jgi:hypothetical protein
MVLAIRDITMGRDVQILLRQKAGRSRATQKNEVRATKKDIRAASGHMRQEYPADANGK